MSLSTVDQNHVLSTAQTIYYVAGGLGLLGTGLRFLWQFLMNLREDKALVEEVREKHLPALYAALNKIGERLELDLNLPRPQTPPED